MKDEAGDDELKSQMHWGQVRASPYGACLTQRNAEKWHGWRSDALEPLVFPVNGFDHLYGQSVIDQVDQTPLGAKKIILDKLGLKQAVAKEAFDGHDYGSTKTPGE